MSSVDSEPADPVQRALHERAQDSVRVERVLDYHRNDIDYRRVKPGDVTAALDTAPDEVAVEIRGHTGLTHIRRLTDAPRLAYHVWSYSFMRERTDGFEPETVESASRRRVRELVDGRRFGVKPIEASAFGRISREDLVRLHRCRVESWEAENDG